MNSRLAKLPPSVWYTIALALAVAVSYALSLRVGFLSDDFVLLSEAKNAPNIASLFGISPTWFFYRPLGKVAWFIEYRLFGYHAAFYHVVNMGLHWLNCLLVMLVARRFMNNGAAWLTAGIFAVFPLYTETVAWLACQYDLLATLGYLAALLGLTYWWSSRRIGWYALAFVAYQCSVWSKETAFTWPLIATVLLFIEYRRLPLGRFVLAMIPFAVILGINLLQRYLVWGNIGGYPGSPLPESLSIAVSHTLFTLLAPLHQFLFPAWLVQLWAAIVVVVLLAGVVLAKDRRPFVFGLIWLLAALVPAFKVLPVGPDLQNSRVLYFPAIGMVIMLAASLDALTRRFVQPVRLGVAAAVMLVCTLVVAVQLGPWNRAGENARHLLEEVHRLMPALPSETQVEVAGLPDNLQGAYVYRLGFDHAYGHFFNTILRVTGVGQLASDVADTAGTNAQIGFGFDSAAQRWEVVSIRRVDHGDTATDADVWRWQVAEQAAPGAWLESPPIAANHAGWAEVIVVADSPANGSGRLLLELPGAAHEQGASFALRDGLRSYHLFLSPADGSQSLERLRVAVEGASGVTVRTVAVRFIQ